MTQNLIPKSATPVTLHVYDKVSAIVMISVSQRQRNSVPQIVATIFLAKDYKIPHLTSFPIMYNTRP